MRIPPRDLLLLTGLLLLGALIAPAVVGSATTGTFGELPAQPVDALSISLLAFGYTLNGVASADATFGDKLGPPSFLFLTPPHLEGNSLGLLTLDFSIPIVVPPFGSQLSIEAMVDAEVGVKMFNSSMTPISSVITPEMVPSAECAGEIFDYNGAPNGAPGSHAPMQFNGQQATPFALDNFSFVAVPEPNLTWLIVPALAGGLAWQRRACKGVNPR